MSYSFWRPTTLATGGACLPLCPPATPLSNLSRLKRLNILQSHTMQHLSNLLITDYMKHVAIFIFFRLSKWWHYKPRRKCRLVLLVFLFVHKFGHTSAYIMLYVKFDYIVHPRSALRRLMLSHEIRKCFRQTQFG